MSASRHSDDDGDAAYGDSSITAPLVAPPPLRSVLVVLPPLGATVNVDIAVAVVATDVDMLDSTSAPIGAVATTNTLHEACAELQASAVVAPPTLTALTSPALPVTDDNPLAQPHVSPAVVFANAHSPEASLSNTMVLQHSAPGEPVSLQQLLQPVASLGVVPTVADASSLPRPWPALEQDFAVHKAMLLCALAVKGAIPAEDADKPWTYGQPDLKLARHGGTGVYTGQVLQTKRQNWQRRVERFAELVEQEAESERNALVAAAREDPPAEEQSLVSPQQPPMCCGCKSQAATVRC